MKYLHKSAVLVGLLALSINLVFGQVNVQKPQALIKSFLYALYQTNQESREIAQHFIALQEAPNELSLTARYQIASEHLSAVRQAAKKPTSDLDKPVLFNPKIHKILSYIETKQTNHINIDMNSEQEKDVYVLVENGRPLRYFYIRDNKIVSFYYFMKGADGPGYFLMY